MSFCSRYTVKSKWEQDLDFTITDDTCNWSFMVILYSSVLDMHLSSAPVQD